MGINAHMITTFALAAALSTGLSRSGLAQTGDARRMRSENAVGDRAKQSMKPASPHAEARGNRPSPDFVWVPGFWDLRGDPATAPAGGWVWAPGRWVVPPVHGARWTPGHWGWRNDWWSWITGHWDEPRNTQRDS